MSNRPGWSTKRRRDPHTNSISAVILLTILAGLTGCFGEDSKPPAVVGQLFSDRVELVLESDEPITEILVEEGEGVTRGQLLLRQDSLRAEHKYRSAEAALEQSRARLDELRRGPRQEVIDVSRANLSGAEKELIYRRTEYERIAQLVSTGLAADGDLDAARAALDSAAAAFAMRRSELDERLTGTTPEELKQAQAAVDQAEAQKELALIDLSRHELRAPADGIVDSRILEIGERPGKGQPALILLQGTQPHARVYLPERIRANVQPGAQATVYIDGIAEPVPGTVRWVATESAFTPYFALTERDRGRLSYIAKIDLEHGERRLPDGLPLEAVIASDSRAR